MPDRYWANPFTRRQTLLLRLSVVPWVAGVLLFSAWWFRPEHYVSLLGSVVGTAVLFFELLLPGYFYAFIMRIKVVSRAIQPNNDWKLAIVVTRAPSEPWEVVQKTLLAMINQDIRHDTWLADERPTKEILDWCEANRVFVSSRCGIIEYHQPSWPRRTRCKEGNLAYFYDHYGYEKYDFVAQLDADHVPNPSYLREIVKPFVDPTVGYVAAPSICDANAGQSWSARGRLYAEATLHGPLQCGYNENWAPLCIGSHYCVRTKALKEIGGLGPELAEDHSTTLMMNAHGWKGVFQPNAIAHGDGPDTFPDCMTQEFQWSRSLMVILLRYTPKYFSKLSARAKFQFLFSQVWYTLFSTVAVIGYAIPIVCLMLDDPLLRMTYLDFLIYSFGVSLLNFLPIVLLKQYGLLRPANARLISWEYTLFTICRFPWVFAGIISGIFSCVSGKELEFRVTPKGKDQSPPLLTRMLTPYLIVSISCATAVILLANRSQSAGYYFLALISAFLMWLAASLIVYLHYVEGATIKISKISKSCFWLVLSGGLIIIGAITRLPQSLSVIFDHYTTGLTADLQKALRVHTTEFHASLSKTNHITSFRTCQPSPCFGYHDHTGSLVRQNVPADIVLSFIPWGEGYKADIVAFVTQAEISNSVPVLTLELWPWAIMDLEPKTTYLERETKANKALLRAISNGTYDDFILNSLKAASDSSKSTVIIRPMHEMESTKQYPWYTDDPNLYISAFRHIVSLSRRERLDNLRWMWSPVGFAHASSYWPGEDVVDYVGLSIYATPEWNGGLASKTSNLSMDTLLKSRYWVRKYSKPIIIAEAGVNDNSADRIQWLKQAFSDLKYYPEVVGWVYFNQQQPPVITLDFGLPDWALSDAEAWQLKKLVTSLKTVHHSTVH